MSVGKRRASHRGRFALIIDISPVVYRALTISFREVFNVRRKLLSMTLSFIGPARHDSPFSCLPAAEGEHPQHAAELCVARATGTIHGPHSTSAPNPAGDSLPLDSNSFPLSMTVTSGKLSVAVIFGMDGKVYPKPRGCAANISQTAQLQWGEPHKAPQPAEFAGDSAADSAGCPEFSACSAIGPGGGREPDCLESNAPSAGEAALQFLQTAWHSRCLG